MIKELWHNIKALVALVCMLTSIVAAVTVAYKTGYKNGARKMASYYPEIRRQAVINALAPRNKENE